MPADGAWGGNADAGTDRVAPPLILLWHLVNIFVLHLLLLSTVAAGAAGRGNSELRDRLDGSGGDGGVVGFNLGEGIGHGGGRGRGRDLGLGCWAWGLLGQTNNNIGRRTVLGLLGKGYVRNRRW